MPSVFARLAQQASGLALDIGANTGVFELLAAAANPQLRVCAFEPLESVRELLYENLARNPDLAPRIAVEPFALSRADGSFMGGQKHSARERLSWSRSMSRGMKTRS